MPALTLPQATYSPSHQELLDKVAFWRRMVEEQAAKEGETVWPLFSSPIPPDPLDPSITAEQLPELERGSYEAGKLIYPFAVGLPTGISQRTRLLRNYLRDKFMQLGER